MLITNLNPREDIGASAWHIEVENRRLLLDSGIHPKLLGNESLPLFDKVREKRVDVIAISHCHFDHVGSLPVALEHFPEAQVMMSELSRVIVDRVLHNSVNVMEMQREEHGISEYPFYRHRQLDRMVAEFRSYAYNRRINIPSGRKRNKAPTLEFLDAGHALGSAGIHIRGREETLFYTGDVCFRNQTLLKGARFKDVKADVLILETTRGDREVPPQQTRESEIERLLLAMRDVFDKGGSVLIPVFALGRTQEILALLALLMEKGRLRRQTIHVGGLGRSFTEIYDRFAHLTPRNHPELNLQKSLQLNVLDRRKLDGARPGKGRHLYAVTAGMMSENTPAHELATRMIEDERQAIFFVGYAGPETPAGRLRAAPHGTAFHFSDKAGELTRRCNLQEFDLTAHANRDELLDFVGQVSPRTVILAHGEEESLDWFAAQIPNRYPDIRVHQPGPGQTVEA